MVGWLGRGGRANTLDVTDRSRLFTCLVVLAEDDNANYHDDITSFFNFIFHRLCLCFFILVLVYRASVLELIIGCRYIF